MQQRISAATQHGQLINSNHELVALGDCELQPDGEIRMQVAEEHVPQPHLKREQLTLVLDDGKAITVSNRFIRLQVRGSEGRTSTVYRLHTVQD